MEKEAIQDVPILEKTSISEILEELDRNDKIDRGLPGGGFLHVSKPLPFLIIHRLEKDEETKDPETVRVVISEAAYLLIGDEDFDGYQQLIYDLGEKYSAKFKSFLFFEIYSGKTGSRDFRIKGPTDLLPSTVKVLKKELNKIKSKYLQLGLKTQVENTKKRQEKGKEALLDIDKVHQAGGLLLGLEIPMLHRNDEGEEFPIFFRNFKDLLIKAIHKSVYDFIRVQTSSGVSSYMALGRKYLKPKVFDIDQKLAEIERSFQFLMLVSPANIRQIQQEFFDSGFEEVLDYHYRLLPVDPDLLKRRLYNLKIEKIDDPAISFLFREKREELDHQITMLNERGISNFFYNSVRLYGTVKSDLEKAALSILKEVPEAGETEMDKQVSATDFAALARKEFEYFKKQDPDFKSQVHIKDNINTLMVSQGELYIPSDYTMNPEEANALLQHEVGTHVLTYHNGMQQPLELMAVGFANYDTLQEGLAVMSEFLVGGLTANRMRTLAGRVVAGAALFKGKKFKSIFKLLHKKHGFSPDRAFNIVSRIMQGGGFLKDIIYLKGLVSLRKHLMEGGNLEPLLMGKFSLEHYNVVRELYERHILRKSKIRPRYLDYESTQKKLDSIRGGLPIAQMIDN
jgi:uncharacterized protein (TIGR02421 family)